MQVAAGCVFGDGAGRVMLVKPTYKEPWDIPGGSLELGESPWEACRREVREELGIDVVPGRLLAVDYRRPVAGGRGDALRFVFDGGVLGPAELARIRLAADELSEWRFVDPADLDGMVIPVMARRLRACLAAMQAVYLEEGTPPA